MSDENTSIHEFDFDLICEYFASMERQGPGSPEVTVQALKFVDGLTEQSRIADLGCGTGGQTMTLARHAPGRVTGVDLFPQFIDIFNQNAKGLGLGDRVQGIVGSMEKLPFDKGTLDLVWAEGSIYNIGFERGLNEWRQCLKQDAYIAVTEASWFTAKRPDEINDFWMEAYPEMDTIPNKVLHMQQAGYLPVATFVLPENCWTKHFYDLQAEAQKKILEKYAGSQTVENFISYQRHEMELYYKYKKFYGYVFYIGKKI